MRISIIIPAHNEEAYLKSCLNSFTAQTHTPDELIIVDDNSSDNTFTISTEYSTAYDWIKVVQRKSTDVHLPGKKVVNAFNYGLSHTSAFDLIGKFDADIILPDNYFETMLNHFQADWKLGICSGLLYVKKNGQWTYENIADKNHVRGPIKLYHKACFEKIGGLKANIGWDTVDVLMAKFHDFHVKTDESLKVKHLRPTGEGYTVKNYRNKGTALYHMGYGITLAKIALLKMAWRAKSPKLYVEGIFAYLWAWIKGKPQLVNKEERRFIRKLRWKGILGKIKPKSQ